MGQAENLVSAPATGPRCARGSLPFSSHASVATFLAPFSRVFSQRTKRTVLYVSLAFSKQDLTALRGGRGGGARQRPEDRLADDGGLAKPGTVPVQLGPGGLWLKQGTPHYQKGRL